MADSDLESDYFTSTPNVEITGVNVFVGFKSPLGTRGGLTQRSKISLLDGVVSVTATKSIGPVEFFGLNVEDGLHTKLGIKGDFFSGVLGAGFTIGTGQYFQDYHIGIRGNIGTSKLNAFVEVEFSDVPRIDLPILGKIHSYLDYNLRQGIGIGNKCFPSGTQISLPDGDAVSIEDIRINQKVVCYGSNVLEKIGNNSSALTSSLKASKVTRLFHNISIEWVILSTTGKSDTKNFHEITSTPGHVFLCPDGQFRRLCDMIDSSVVPLNSDALAHKEGAEHYRPIGMVEIVLEDGTIAKAEAHSIKYSAATAHLYEEAEMLITRTEGGLAVKPEMKKGWKTYNFEVAEHHTYIADGIDPAANDNFRGRAAA